MEIKAVICTLGVILNLAVVGVSGTFAVMLVTDDTAKKRTHISNGRRPIFLCLALYFVLLGLIMFPVELGDQVTACFNLRKKIVNKARWLSDYGGRSILYLLWGVIILLYHRGWGDTCHWACYTFTALGGTVLAYALLLAAYRIHEHFI